MSGEVGNQVCLTPSLSSCQHLLLQQGQGREGNSVVQKGLAKGVCVGGVVEYRGRQIQCQVLLELVEQREAPSKNI